MRKLVQILGLAATGLAMTACSAQPQANASSSSAEATTLQVASQADVHPTSGLSIIDVTVESGRKRHTFRTELADTPQAQAKGMMFRNEMGDDEAMLFPSDLPTPRSFWMKNTPLSLDIIFIGPDGTISNIAANAEPYSEKSLLSDGPTIGVLELRGGLAAELGIKPGDAVAWPKADAGE